MNGPIVEATSRAGSNSTQTGFYGVAKYSVNTNRGRLVKCLGQMSTVFKVLGSLHASKQLYLLTHVGYFSSYTTDVGL